MVKYLEKFLIKINFLYKKSIVLFDKKWHKPTYFVDFFAFLLYDCDMSALKKTMVLIFIISLVIGITSMFFVVSKNYEKVYATKISVVGVPREIELVSGNYIMFDTLPCKLTPAECDNTVKVEVTDYNSNKTEHASFDHLIFRAYELGNYFIKFSTKNMYGKVLQDSIKIKVIKPSDATTGFVKLLNGYIKIEAYSQIFLNDMVDVVNDDDVVEFFENGQPIPCNYVFHHTGSYCICAGLDEQGYKKCIDISVVVVLPKEYSIAVCDAFGNFLSTKEEYTVTISQKVLELTYSIADSTMQIVSASCDTDCIKVVSCDAPIICCEIVQTGKCVLTIKYRDLVQNYSIVVK